MRRLLISGCCLVVSLSVLGCGDGDVAPVDSGAVEPPENPERDLPTAGGPEDDEFEAPEPPEDYERDDYVSGGAEDGECCPVVFAFAPENPAEVESALLRGDLSPLNGAEGIALDESEGVWSAEACLAPDQYGTYYYALSLRSAGGEEPFLSVAYNPYAPTAEAAGELVNAWLPAEDCASVDVSVHAQISEP